MKKKSKLIKWLLVGCFAVTLTVHGMGNVNAENDFAQNEREYMEKCSSSNLSRADIAVCEEFNSYLKDKTNNIKANISTLESTLETTKDKINAVHETIESFNTQIAEKQVEIDYILANITNTQADISYREGLLKDRLYAMQVYSNSNQFLNFILGAASFSDLFSRIEGVNDLTSYDKELIAKLNADKKQLEEQKAWAEESKTTLENMKNEQVAKQEEFNALVAEYTQQLESQQEAAAEGDHLNAALSAALNESRVSLEQQEWLANGGGWAGGEATGDAASVISFAVSKLGLPYGWGATGPSAYDCSGLTSQAYLNGAGIWIGRTTWDQIKNGVDVGGMGNLQPGDLIFFSTDGYCSHVGMYVGNGVMIHAPQPGSNVMYSSINSSYWQSTFCGARRYL